MVNVKFWSEVRKKGTPERKKLFERIFIYM